MSSTSCRISGGRAPHPRARGGRCRLAARICLFLLLAAVSVDAQVPEAPPGFSWQAMEAIRGAVLKPSGWVFVGQKKDDGWEFSESHPKGQSAFLLSVVKGAGPRTDAKKLADDFLTGLSNRLAAEGTWGGDEGAFVMRAGFFLDSPKTGTPEKSFQQILVNPKTGTLFRVAFRAPARTWDADWKIGEVICRFLLLDDEI